MIDRPDNINIFILYATEDQPLKKELEGHLSFLQRLGYIDVWHEGQVQPGLEKEQVVSEYLEKAHIILLLISANFLAPDHYTKYENELRMAYARQKEGKVMIIPVILRHCVWQLDILAGLNPLPSGGHPVRSDHWESVDKAFHDITVALQKVAEDIKGKSEASAAPEIIPITAQTISHPINKAEEIVEAIPPIVEAVSKPADVFEFILRDLFDALFSLSIDEALRLFVPIAHRSLVNHGKLDDYFRQHNLEVAYNKARQYKRPAEIISKKPTGRRKIGPRNDKDTGEEFGLTLARISETGGMPGQVRIFRSSVDNKLTVSGLSL